MHKPTAYDYLHFPSCAEFLSLSFLIAHLVILQCHAITHLNSEQLKPSLLLVGCYRYRGSLEEGERAARAVEGMSEGLPIFGLAIQVRGRVGGAGKGA